jgi:expansin (peptidoglycan-binding protein)
MRYALLIITTMLCTPVLRAQTWEYGQLTMAGGMPVTWATGDSSTTDVAGLMASGATDLSPDSSRKIAALLPKRLNALGAQRWELVTVVPTSRNWTYIFKRRTKP